MSRMILQALSCAFALVISSSAIAAGTVHRVQIEGMRYVPDRLEAAVGDTIVWTNRDLVPHTVSAGSTMESGSIEANKSWAFKVSKKGTVAYVCRFHPGMQGAVTVK